MTENKIQEDDKQDQFNISVELQRDILSLMMTDRDFLIRSSNLVNHNYFTDLAHRIICKIIKDYFDEYNNPITLEILTQEINEKNDQNRQLPRILSELDIISERTIEVYSEKEYLSKATVDFAKAQAMKNAIMKSVDLIGTQEYDKIEQLIREALLVAPDTSLGMNFFEDINERYQRILANLEGERYTTCFPTLDRDLNGGISKKEIGMIFAPPSVGKSLFLTMVAITNVLKGKNVLYVSCEMAEDRVGMRADAMISLIPIEDLIKKFKELKDRLQLVSQKSEGRLYIKEFPAGEATISDIRAYVNQLHNYTGFKPEIIVLDYIDEIRCSNKNADTYQGQIETTREFRAWMSTDNYAGYTATQSNREARSVKVATDAQIADSYGKVRIVDAMWSLNQTDEEAVRNTARLFVVKHRNGKKRYIIYVYIDPYTLKMKEITEQDYERIMGTNTSNPVLTEENA
jgi:replicative DNA helicase